MKRILLVLIVGLILAGTNVFADDVSIDSDGNVTTGVSNPDGNLEVTGSSGEDGIVGLSSGTGAGGVYGENTTYSSYGILGYNDYGVYGNSSGYAGYFQGDARVTGNLNVGSLTGYTETDPVFGASTAFGIVAGQVTNWNTAYGWGFHGSAGYLTAETDPSFTVSPASGISAGQISNWDSAFGWGNHSVAGYDTTNDSWTGTGTVYTTSGNVGIGTSSPATTLHVESRDDDFASVRIGSNNAYDAGLIFFTSAADWTIGVDQSDSGKLTFGLNHWIPGNSTKVTLDTSGNFGIGTTSPSYKLEAGSTSDTNNYVRVNSNNWGGVLFYDGEGSHSGMISYVHSSDYMVFQTRDGVGAGERMRITSDGDVGIGTTTPGTQLSLGGSGSLNGITVGEGQTTETKIYHTIDATRIDGPNDRIQFGSMEYIEDCGGNCVNLDPGSTTGRVNIPAHLYVNVLHINGGADLAEPFDTSSSDNIRPGMVMSIDPENPGQLRIADKSYDKTVAGIVSGANGINAGLILTQEGTAADGSVPVALTGRVYAWADASYGAIEPGDLLTTSDTPGHAMKVTDHDKGPGTIIGKAMTSISEGKGLVLVLVTLQ